MAQQRQQSQKISRFISSIAQSQRVAKSAAEGAYREWGVTIGRVVDIEDPNGLRRIKVATESKDLKVSSDWAIRCSQSPWGDGELPRVGQAVLVAAVGGDPHDLVVLGVLNSTLLTDESVEGIDNEDGIKKKGAAIGPNPAPDWDFKSQSYPLHRRSEGGQEDKDLPDDAKGKSAEFTQQADQYPDWGIVTEAVDRCSGKTHRVSEGLHHHERVSFEEAIKLPQLPNPKGYFYRAENYTPNGPDEGRRHQSPGLPPEHMRGLWTGMLYVESAEDQRFVDKPKYKDEHSERDEVLILLRGSSQYGRTYSWERVLTTEATPYGKVVRQQSYVKLGVLGVDLEDGRLTGLTLREPQPQQGTLGYLWAGDEFYMGQDELPTITNFVEFKRELGKTLQTLVEGTVESGEEELELPDPEGEEWKHIDEKREEYQSTLRRQWVSVFQKYREGTPAGDGAEPAPAVDPKGELRAGSSLYVVAKVSPQFVEEEDGKKPTQYRRERVAATESSPEGKILRSQGALVPGILERVEATKIEKARLKGTADINKAITATREWHEDHIKAEEKATEFYKKDRRDKDYWGKVSEDETETAELFKKAAEKYGESLELWAKVWESQTKLEELYPKTSTIRDQSGQGFAQQEPTSVEGALWLQASAEIATQLSVVLQNSKQSGSDLAGELVITTQSYRETKDKELRARGKVAKIPGLLQLGTFSLAMQSSTSKKSAELLESVEAAVKSSTEAAGLKVKESKVEESRASEKPKSKDWETESAAALSAEEKANGLWEEVAKKEVELQKEFSKLPCSLLRDERSGVLSQDEPSPLSSVSEQLQHSIWGREWSLDDKQREQGWASELRVLLRESGKLVEGPLVKKERIITTTATQSGKRVHVGAFLKLGTVHVESARKFVLGEDQSLSDVMDSDLQLVVDTEPPDSSQEKDSVQSQLWQGTLWAWDSTGTEFSSRPTVLKTILRSDIAILKEPEGSFWREHLLSTDSSEQGKRVQTRAYLALGIWSNLEKGKRLSDTLSSTLLHKSGDRISESEPPDDGQAGLLSQKWRGHMWMKSYQTESLPKKPLSTRQDDILIMKNSRKGETWRERVLATEGVDWGKLSTLESFCKVGILGVDIRDKTGRDLAKTAPTWDKKPEQKKIYEGVLWGAAEKGPRWSKLESVELTIALSSKSNELVAERILRTERLESWSTVQLQDILKLSEAGDTVRPEKIDGNRSIVTLPKASREWGGALVFLPGIQQGSRVGSSYLGTVAQNGQGEWSWGHVLHSRKSRNSDSWVTLNNSLLQIADISQTSTTSGISAGKLYPQRDSKIKFPAPDESWAGYIGRSTEKQGGQKSTLYMCLPNQKGDHLWERVLTRETTDGLYTLPLKEVPILPKLSQVGIKEFGLESTEAGVSTETTEFVGALYQLEKLRPTEIRTIQQNIDGVVADERVITTETLVYQQQDGTTTGSRIVRFTEGIKLAVSPSIPSVSEDMIGLTFVTDESPGRMFVVLRDCYGSPQLQEIATSAHTHGPIEQPAVACGDDSPRPQSINSAGPYFIPR